MTTKYFGSPAEPKNTVRRKQHNDSLSGINRKRKSADKTEDS